MNDTITENLAEIMNDYAMGDVEPWIRCLLNLCAYIEINYILPYSVALTWVSLVVMFIYFIIYIYVLCYIVYYELLYHYSRLYNFFYDVLIFLSYYIIIQDCITFFTTF